MSFLDKEGLAYLWQQIVAKLDRKVSTEEGKGLSTNDYTNADKEKVNNIETTINNAIANSITTTLNTEV